MHDFTLFLFPWRLEVISSIFRDFKVFTLLTRLRCFDRRLDTRTEAFPSIPSHPQGPRKARKPSRTSKDSIGPRNREIRSNHITIRLNKTSFGRMTFKFGRMGIKLQGNVLKLVGNPEWSSIQSNGCPFGRMEAPDCANSFLCKFIPERF